MAQNADNQAILMKWVDEPDSAYIRDDLNNQHAKTCPHGRVVCYLRCGVTLDFTTSEWRVIPRVRRRRWLDSVLA
jgi:hypothetical protein